MMTTPVLTPTECDAIVSRLNVLQRAVLTCLMVDPGLHRPTKRPQLTLLVSRLTGERTLVEVGEAVRELHNLHQRGIDLAPFAVPTPPRMSLDDARTTVSCALGDATSMAPKTMNERIDGLLRLFDYTVPSKQQANASRVIAVPMTDFDRDAVVSRLHVIHRAVLTFIDIDPALASPGHLSLLTMLVGMFGLHHGEHDVARALTELQLMHERGFPILAFDKPTMARQPVHEARASMARARAHFALQKTTALEAVLLNGMLRLLGFDEAAIRQSVAAGK